MFAVRLREHRERRERRTRDVFRKAGFKSNFVGRRSIQEEDSDLVCYICLEGLFQGEVVSKLPYGHAFHSPCLEQWFRVHHSCPVRCNLEAQAPPPSPEQQQQVTSHAP